MEIIQTNFCKETILLYFIKNMYLCFLKYYSFRMLLENFFSMFHSFAFLGFYHIEIYELFLMAPHNISLFSLFIAIIGFRLTHLLGTYFSL
jgi:hypothetical protein